eukprot:1158805-Pelagomonas_calceolata.AAC.2
MHRFEPSVHHFKPSKFNSCKQCQGVSVAAPLVRQHRALVEALAEESKEQPANCLAACYEGALPNKQASSGLLERLTGLACPNPGKAVPLAQMVNESACNQQCSDA